MKRNQLMPWQLDYADVRGLPYVRIEDTFWLGTEYQRREIVQFLREL